MKIKFTSLFIINFTLCFLFGCSVLTAQESRQQFAEIGDFKLENGHEIKNCKIGYRSFGQINLEKNNIILMPTWFGGTSESLQNLAGEDKLIDTTKYFLVAVDALGDGVSSSPSNSSEQPLNEFPEFTIKDMVNSQYKMLTEVLGINHLYGIIGGSMGGMQAFQWIVSYPDFMDRVISYVGSPKLTSIDMLLWTAELNAINQGRSCRASEKEILKTVSAIQTFAIQTPEYRIEKTSRENFNDFINETYTGWEKFFNSYNWASQLKAMMSHDISKDYNYSLKEAAERIKAKLFIIVSESDLIVNPTTAVRFADLSNSELFILKNNCGHLAPGCEWEKFQRLIMDFFNAE